jgi:hypothetical protein
VRAIITLIVAVGVIPVGVMTIIIGLTLIVIAIGRPVIRSTLIVATIGIPWSYGNGNLGFRFRRNQSEEPKDSQDQEEILFHRVLSRSTITRNGSSCLTIPNNQRAVPVIFESNIDALRGGRN